ncbi:MAG: sulfatase [Pirellulales bacterium]
MSIRPALWFIGLLSVFAAVPTVAVAADTRPNFVFIIGDDISWDDLGCYGNSVIATPNIDRLAREGRIFDRAYLTASSCSPTRCSIVTGRYPHNTGAPELHTPLPKGQFMFPQALREAGYYTVLSGKQHMGPAVQPAFDHISPGKGPGKEGDWVQTLRDRPRDRPFFCWFAAYDAHRDWQTTDHARRYSPEEVPVPPYLYDGPRTREDLANHYHEVSRLDSFVGKVREELELQQIAEQTYIIFCADNGRPFPRCKTRLYDSGIRTPFIVWRLGKVAHDRSNSLISVIDLAPTILQLAGVPLDDRLQGVSFAPVLENPQATVRDFAFAEHNWHVGQAHERMLRSGRWLYIRNAWPERQHLCAEANAEYPTGAELYEAHEQGLLNEHQQDVFRESRPAEELYDVVADPHQLRNLAGVSQFQGTLKELRSSLDAWSVETGDSVPANATPDDRDWFGRKLPDFARGEMPGAVHGADGITRSGPIRQPN